MKNSFSKALQAVVQIYNDGAIKQPIAIDIAYELETTKIGLMHSACTEHLPDEGWEYLGRAVLDRKRMRQFVDDHGMMCDWCGNNLFRKAGF